MNAPASQRCCGAIPVSLCGGEVVDVPDEGPDRRVQLGQGEPGLPGPVRGAARRVPGQGWQAHLVDGAKRPLHLAPPAGLPGQGEIGPDLQLGHHLLQVRGGEVRAVVDVERLRDAAHVPAGPRFAPDRLAERQRGGQRRRGAEVDRVPGDRPGVIVLDQGQPRPARLTRRGEHPQVQQGVVGLPDLVRLGGLAAVHQVEHLLVPLGALVREGGHRRADAADDRVDRGVGRDGPSFPLRDRGDLAVHMRGGRGRRAQRQALDQEPQRLGEAGTAPVGARGPAQASQPGSGPATAATSRAGCRTVRPRGSAERRPRRGPARPASGDVPLPGHPRRARSAPSGQVRPACDRALPGRLHGGQGKIRLVWLQGPV